MNETSPSPSRPAAAPPPLPPPGADFWADFDKDLSPPRPPPPAPPVPPRRRLVGPGQRLGLWELLRTRGRGGMGEVFEAYFEPAHRRFALKILGIDAHDDPEARTRFAYEYWALDHLHHKLRHESIVAPFCAGEDEGLRWYAMELLEGESLDHVINRRVLAPRSVCRIGVQIADACAAMHAIGLIHRDLKPGNIFLLKGEGDRVKLLDTGIVKLLPEFFADAEMRPQVEERLQTLAGAPIGTPGFMAPEVLLGAKAAPAQDIFGLAATLFRLAVGRHAYPSLLAPGSGDEPRWSEELGRPLPRALEVVLRKALTVDPSRRQSSMSELRAQLDLVLEELEHEAAEAEAEESEPAAGEPRREAAAPTVIEIVARSEGGGGESADVIDVGPVTSTSEVEGGSAPIVDTEPGGSGREAIAIEPVARPGEGDDLPAPHAGGSASELGDDGGWADDDERPAESIEVDSPAQVASSGPRRGWILPLIAGALACVAAGFALGRLPGEADGVIDRWTRVAAATRSIPPPAAEPALPPAPEPVPEVSEPPETLAGPPDPELLATDDSAVPPRPRRLSGAAFRDVVRSEAAALAPCVEVLPEGAEIAAEVRVRPDGTVESVRLVPDVSFIALRCARKALGGLRFPRADAPSTHTWPLRRP